MYIYNYINILFISLRNLTGNRALKNRGNFSQRAIPVFFHGDGVPLTGLGKTWGRSANVWNWGSLLARGTTQEVVLWIYSCIGDTMIQGKTLKKFYKIMRWSFSCLWNGVWPAADWDERPYSPNSPEGRRAGTPLVGTMVDHCLFCVLWLLKGDLDFHQKDIYIYIYVCRYTKLFVYIYIELFM